MPTFSELVSRLHGFPNRDLGTGASEAEICSAEHALNVQIEGGYRRFLSQFGWGGVDCLEMYGLGGAAYLDLVRVTKSERAEMNPALPVYLLPIMNDGGGNLFCLDTRVVGEPPVVFWDHAAGGDQEPEVESTSFLSWLWAQLDELG